MKTLHNDRFILRDIQPTDTDDFFEYAKDPTVGPKAGWPPVPSQQAAAEILKLVKEKQATWAIEWLEDGKMIGTIALRPCKLRHYDGAKEIGMALHPGYQGRGVITEAVAMLLKYAFEELAAPVVSISHFTDNGASRRVIEKCGFRPEGVLHKGYLNYDDTFKDLAVYAITREEYCEKPRP